MKMTKNEIFIAKSAVRNAKRTIKLLLPEGRENYAQNDWEMAEIQMKLVAIYDELEKISRKAMEGGSGTELT
jgi:hypothetical protein|nr:MAG TPA: hypothetical protein [Caudoviricetes sp.]